MKKVVFLFIFVMIMLPFGLFASGNTDHREIQKTDISLTPEIGESEIVFNYIHGPNPVSIYINGKLVAQCFGPTIEDDILLEKIIVKNGTIIMDAVIKELKKLERAWFGTKSGDSH
jgi:hypothetical protein